MDVPSKMLVLAIDSDGWHGAFWDASTLKMQLQVVGQLKIVPRDNINCPAGQF